MGNPADLLADREHKVQLSISEEHKCREAFNVFATKDLPNYIKLTEMKEILRIIGGPSSNSLSLERQLAICESNQRAGYVHYDMFKKVIIDWKHRFSSSKLDDETCL